jgi:hypothetical protein
MPWRVAVAAVAGAVPLCVAVPLAERALLQRAVPHLMPPELTLLTARLPAAVACGWVVVTPTCAAGTPAVPHLVAKEITAVTVGCLTLCALVTCCTTLEAHWVCCIQVVAAGQQSKLCLWVIKGLCAAVTVGVLLLACVGGYEGCAGGSGGQGPGMGTADSSRQEEARRGSSG